MCSLLSSNEPKPDFLRFWAEKDTDEAPVQPAPPSRGTVGSPSRLGERTRSGGRLRPFGRTLAELLTARA